uniref:TATA box binding protein associated factor (TAF) histone-like fold domain-containing protein n=1 Tax=Timema cristinae TaxID=61476 RepID=A0A7R9GTR5_TIMCR|nr:unnamed protein product [Timema cristinae]
MHALRLQMNNAAVRHYAMTEVNVMLLEERFSKLQSCTSTRSIPGTLHREVRELFGGQLKPGCALVLRHVGVLGTRKSSRRHYLNITSNNIISIYYPCGDADLRVVRVQEVSLNELASSVHSVQSKRISETLSTVAVHRFFSSRKVMNEETEKGEKSSSEKSKKEKKSSHRTERDKHEQKSSEKSEKDKSHKRDREKDKPERKSSERSEKDKSDKNAKSQLPSKKRDEKKTYESPKYAFFSVESIVTAAGSVGIPCLNEDVAKHLAEDVSYRMREFIFQCSNMMRRYNQKKLTTDIVNSVCKDTNVPEVLGHSAVEPLGFTCLEEEDLFLIDECDIDLEEFAFSHEMYTQPREPSIYCEWIYPETSSSQSEKKDESRPSTSSVNPPSTHKDDSKHSKTSTLNKPVNTPQVPSHLVAYFRQFANVIMGSSKNLLELVLEDLQSNWKIGLVIPFFLNLVSFGLQKIPHTSSTTIRFFRVIDAIIRNKRINPEGSVSVSRLISALLHCAVDVKVPNEDDYEFRWRAASTLSQVLEVWCRSEIKLYRDILHKLGTELLNTASPLRAHYGVLVTLYMLGPIALDQCLWPQLASYLKFVKMKSHPSTTEFLQVNQALLMAAELLYYREWRDGDMWYMTPVIDKLLYEHFGDTLMVAKAYGTPQKPLEENLSLTKDVPVPFAAKKPVTIASQQTVINEDLAYLNWTFLAPLPRNLDTLLKKGTGASSEHSKKYRKPSIPLTVHNAFELPPKKENVSDIILFAFAGSNPVPKESLHRKVLDPYQCQFIKHSPYHKKCCRLRYIGKLPHGDLYTVPEPSTLGSSGSSQDKY